MNICIIGSGNHAAVVIEAIRNLGEYKVISLMDDTCVGESRHGFVVEPVEVEGHPSLCHIAIGENSLREKYSREIFDFTSIAHPEAVILGEGFNSSGSFFAAGCIIGVNSKVGNFSIVNTACVLEHDCQVGDFTHLAPGVVTGGRVKIGSRTFIGLSAAIKDGITIGNNCIVGMGAVVLEDVPDNTVWFGNPAKFQRPKFRFYDHC